jgi:hypothetical protein
VRRMAQDGASLAKVVGWTELFLCLAFFFPPLVFFERQDERSWGRRHRARVSFLNGFCPRRTDQVINVITDAISSLLGMVVVLQEKNAPIPASLPKTGKSVVEACDRLVSVAKELAADEYERVLQGCRFD